MIEEELEGVPPQFRFMIKNAQSASLVGVVLVVSM